MMERRSAMENMEPGKRVEAEHMAQGKEMGMEQSKLGFGNRSSVGRPVELVRRVSLV